MRQVCAVANLGISNRFWRQFNKKIRVVCGKLNNNAFMTETNETARNCIKQKSYETEHVMWNVKLILVSS